MSEYTIWLCIMFYLLAWVIASIANGVIYVQGRETYNPGWWLSHFTLGVGVVYLYFLALHVIVGAVAVCIFGIVDLWPRVFS